MSHYDPELYIRKKLLLIAASDALRERLCAHLQNTGFQIQVATNGKQTIAQARSLSPDLLLLQTRFPDLTGSEVCRQLRRDPLTLLLPIMLVSEENNMQEGILGLDAGADDYLVLTQHSQTELIGRISTLFAAREAKVLNQDLMRKARKNEIVN